LRLLQPSLLLHKQKSALTLVDLLWLQALPFQSDGVQIGSTWLQYISP